MKVKRTLKCMVCEVCSTNSCSSVMNDELNAVQMIKWRTWKRNSSFFRPHKLDRSFFSRTANALRKTQLAKWKKKFGGCQTFAIFYFCNNKNVPRMYRNVFCVIFGGVLTFTNLASRESPKAGNCSSYLVTACCALTASTHRWHRATM